MYRFGKAFEFGVNIPMRSAGGGGSPVAVTWDAASKSSTVTLSNGDLTASTLLESFAQAKSSISRNSGAWLLEITPTYDGVPDDNLFYAGVAMADWAPAYAPLYADLLNASVQSDGNITGGFGPCGSTFPSGGPFRVRIDSDTGKIWYGDDPTVVSDAEAGQNPHWVLDANTSVVAAFSMQAGHTPTTMTLNPSATSGRFGALNA